MTTDEWVTAALTDDAVVVELLFRLKQSSEQALLRWGNRQPRSKPAAAAAKKEGEWTRCSPTTPLSWSCGGGDASPSDGCDESCRRSDRSSGGRSKGIFTDETAATATTTKRARRKKTFTELKEEESLLLKERIYLKKELARLHVTLEEQKARSENLKRLKLDLHLQSANEMAATTDELEAANSSQSKLAEASTLDHVPVSPTVTIHAECQAPSPCNIEKEVERCFVLPDLNMMPGEEDPDSGLS
ncbi:uncharacterized protein LOC130787252 [Actinidia eriantha]|uniref:uncharacterized protein LOC130787252 n=1 Tax=Actinidia eriantha TaxID=165200 RepID=UPI00258BE504|nr:uncharacterized protein LOC130787252 [Actinidia eriantha]